MSDTFWALPNVGYMTASLLYWAGLILWIGGIVTLGALAAPTLFQMLPRAEAGRLFGAMLSRFEKVSVAAAFAVVVGGTSRAWIGGQVVNVWALTRLGAVTGMLVLLAIAIVHTHPALRRLQEQDPQLPERPEDHEGRLRFQALHRRSERLMMAQLWLGVIVVFLS